MNEVLFLKIPQFSGKIYLFFPLAKVRFLVSCSQGRVYAANFSQVWVISGINIAKQRKLLLDAKQFQLALKLTVSNCRLQLLRILYLTFYL